MDGGEGEAECMSDYRIYREGGMSRLKAALHAAEDWYYSLDRWWNR